MIGLGIIILEFRRLFRVLVGVGAVIFLVQLLEIVASDGLELPRRRASIMRSRNGWFGGIQQIKRGEVRERVFFEAGRRFSAIARANLKTVELISQPIRLESLFVGRLEEAKAVIRRTIAIHIRRLQTNTKGTHIVVVGAFALIEILIELREEIGLLEMRQALCVAIVIAAGGGILEKCIAQLIRTVIGATVRRIRPKVLLIL